MFKPAYFKLQNHKQVSFYFVFLYDEILFLNNLVGNMLYIFDFATEFNRFSFYVTFDKYVGGLTTLIVYRPTFIKYKYN